MASENLNEIEIHCLLVTLNEFTEQTVCPLSNNQYDIKLYGLFCSRNMFSETSRGRSFYPSHINDFAPVYKLMCRTKYLINSLVVNIFSLLKITKFIIENSFFLNQRWISVIDRTMNPFFFVFPICQLDVTVLHC